MIHARTHPTLDVDGCFACKVSSVNWSAAAMPTRNPAVAARVQEHRDFTRDAQAVRDLAREGICPPRVDGAADLVARAESKHEIETGKIIDDPARRKKIVELASALGDAA